MIGFAVFDRDLCFVEINQALADINGLSIEEHLGKRVNEIVERPSEIGLRALRAVLRTGEPVASVPISIERTAGQRKHFVCTYVPIKNDGDVTGVAVLVFDTTEERDRDLWLTQLAANFGFVDLPTSVATWQWYLEKDEAEWSIEHYRLLDQDPASFSPSFRTWLDLVHPDDRDRLAAEMAATIDQPEPRIHIEYRFIRPNGQVRWIAALGKAVAPGAPGVAPALAGLSIDITERKEAQLQLEASEAQYRLLTEMSPELLWSCTPDGKNDFLSRQWVEFTGVPAEEQRGFGWLQTLHPDDHAAVNEKWKISYTTGAPYDLEFRIRRRDGVYRWFKTRARALRDRNGIITKWVGLSADIEDQKRIEDSLRLANENLNHFAYAVSHDLQEPLRTVAAYTQLLERRSGDALPESARALTGQIVDGAKRMQFLIRDLLAYAEASQEGPREAQPIDTARLMEDVQGALQGIIAETGARIDTHGLPVVEGSRIHLFQLFQNLVGNAIKYRSAAPPQVVVSARRVDPFWEFSVQDNGLGIDPAYREKIFRVFQRLHGREIAGTGMGLAICQRIVENHGGRIWVDSAPGQGSTFRFTILCRRDT